ncbi:cold-responsive protein kinase 1 isoform X2 [Cryptomeria japonica]|uniref:cold-responsive protein kinase 1 isoform X2 n=1 Tax=Cryptomeria japonica TaxID=3369 RepID=UPI0027D9D169|nr:cold-responsive protein kinase 1 isoform X2 [Cryptomeria japonica]
MDWLCAGGRLIPVVVTFVFRPLSRSYNGAFHCRMEGLSKPAVICASPSKIVLILVGTLGGAALIAVLCLLFICRHSFRKLHTKFSSRSRREETEVYFIAEEDPNWDHLFSYDSLRSATKKFDPSMKIGEGGFGQVYKGIFNDGREVAVKKLFSQQSTRASDDFVTEVKLISAVRHRNLVRLLGCCTRGLEKLLVYELMPNMSLDRHLFAKTVKPLSWKKRFEIILGTAHGLAYLNEESPFRILHRDIKPANILLDNDFQAKIADFGLARLFPEDRTHLTTRVGGTIGYTAPEYAVHGHLTDKADVYSYGMLVLEIVSGRKYVDSKLPAHMELLLQWAWSLYEKNEAFSMVDERLIEEEPEVNREEILKIIQIALLCTQGVPELRPLMSKVVSMITSNTDILVQPTQPAFIDSESTPNELGSANVEWMEGPSVASSHATVSISLEPR